MINLRIPDDTYMDLQAEAMQRNYKSRAEGSGLTATKSSIARVALEEWLNKNSKRRLDYQKWVDEMASNPDNYPKLDDTNTSTDGEYEDDEQPPDDAETEE